MLSFAGFSLGVMILDLIDPLELNRVLKKTDVKRLTLYIHLLFQKHIPRDFEITPNTLIIMLDAEEQESQFVLNFMAEKIFEYLQSLDANSFGQRLQEQEQRVVRRKEKQKKQQQLPWLQMYAFCGCLILGCLFTNWVVYFMLGYVVFSIYYTTTHLNPFLIPEIQFVYE